MILERGVLTGRSDEQGDNQAANQAYLLGTFPILWEELALLFVCGFVFMSVRLYVCVCVPV